MSVFGNYRSRLASGQFDTIFSDWYADVEEPHGRISTLFDEVERRFSQSVTEEAMLFSAPGRTELGGNHTDHNHGHVLAAAVHLDCLAVARPRTDSRIIIYSSGFEQEITVDVNDIVPQTGEHGTSEGIIRGVVAGVVGNGGLVGGFEACVHSTIPMGAGLSSSAAFEVLIGSIINEFYNSGTLTSLQIAAIAKQAENVFFGKPCGFMDQLACALRGVVHIDFATPDFPEFALVPAVFESSDYQLLVVDTGGDHADLTPDYAAIPDEMFAVAKMLGKSVGRETSLSELLCHLPDLRKKLNDRSILRMIHFIEENERVPRMVQALADQRLQDYLRLVQASGESSWKLLQNCIPLVSPLEQPIPLALTLTERLLGAKGAWRVHGGGFAGTIQAYVPLNCMTEYVESMERVFGKGAVVPLHVRDSETVCLKL